MKLVSYIFILYIGISSFFIKDYFLPFQIDDFIGVQRKFGFTPPKLPSIDPKNCNYNGLIVELKPNAHVFSIDNGKVVEICNSNPISRYGNYLIIEYPGNIACRYYHSDSIFVQKGQSVNKGEKIANSGISGLTTVNGLGIQIKKDDRFINPASIQNIK